MGNRCGVDTDRWRLKIRGPGRVPTVGRRGLRSLVVIVAALVVIQLGSGPVAAIAGSQASMTPSDPAAHPEAPVDYAATGAGTAASPAEGIGHLTDDSPAVRQLLELQDDASPVLAVLLGYRTTGDSDPLDHDARAGLYEVIGESPGTYIAQAAEQADLSVSTARYHLRVLEAEDLIRTKKQRGKRRLYQATAGDEDVAAALNDEATTAVVEAVRTNEPASVTDLAAALDRAQSTVSYHVSRLTDAGVLTRERDGEAVRIELAPAARAVVSVPPPADD